MRKMTGLNTARGCYAQLQLALALCASLWLHGTALAEMRADVHQMRLDNGLEVIVIEDHRAPVVTQMLWYHVGSVDEPAGKSGIAHFLEHLMFKGTERFPDGQFSQIIDQNGGIDNAFTSYDYTAYYQRVARDRLELVMDMEADRMRNLILDEEVVRTERDVILEERKSRIDSAPGAMLSLLLRAKQYAGHPYAIPVIGWEEEIRELNRADALAFYARFYAPNNATLILAGDVTPEEARSLATRYYGPIAPSPDLGTRTAQPLKAVTGPLHLEHADPRVRQPYVLRNYDAPAHRTETAKEAAALSLLAQIMANGPSTPLWQELVLERQEAQQLGSFYDGTSRFNGRFGLYILPTPELSLAEAEAALDRALEAFLQTPIPAELLARAQRQFHAERIYSLDNQEARARYYGMGLASGLSLQDLEDWPEIVAAVTAEDVQMMARRILTKDSAITGYLSQAAGAKEE